MRDKEGAREGRRQGWRQKRGKEGRAQCGKEGTEGPSQGKRGSFQDPGRHRSRGARLQKGLAIKTRGRHGLETVVCAHVRTMMYDASLEYLTRLDGERLRALAKRACAWKARPRRRAPQDTKGGRSKGQRVASLCARAIVTRSSWQLISFNTVSYRAVFVAVVSVCRNAAHARGKGVQMGSCVTVWRMQHHWLLF